MSEASSTPEKKIYYDQRSVALRTKQQVCFVQEQDKIALLDLVVQTYKDIQTVIVVKSKKKADIVAKHLESNGLRVASVHGNHRVQMQRESSSVFNDGLLNVIITTDMILKTLELENIKCVINYDLPGMVQEYYNRLAYMKEEGEAINFVSPEDDKYLASIELNMKKEIEEKVFEGFSPTSSKEISTLKKDRKKKPRHKKMKVKKEADKAQ